MSKVKIDGVIVVEGKTDKDFLLSFLEAEIVMTNGSAVNRETIAYINEISKFKKVIVLTDPDAPGKRIRDILNQNVEGLENAYLPKEVCIKKNKVGIAESTKEAVLEALQNVIPASGKSVDSDLEYSDLLELGLVGSPDSSYKREMVERALHLGHTNGKTLLQRCRALGKNKADLQRLI